ncbi:hypothetical protein PCE1_001535 [Barthelona sp. PCE]
MTSSERVFVYNTFQMKLFLALVTLSVVFAVTKVSLERHVPQEERLFQHYASNGVVKGRISKVNRFGFPTNGDVHHVVIDDYMNAQYRVKANIGKEVGANIMEFIFDTGSSNNFVFGSVSGPKGKGCHCTSIPCIVHQTYKCESFDYSGQQMVLAYGSGNVTVSAGHDHVMIGDIQVHGRLDVVSHVDLTMIAFDTLKASGILGFAFSSIQQSPPGMEQETFMDAAVREQKVDSEIFTLCFSEDSNDAYLGGLPSFIAPGDVQWTPLFRDLWWLTKADVAIGSSVIAQNLYMVIDSGTSAGLVVPTEVYENIMAYPGMYLKPDCSNLDELPTISLIFNGALVHMESKNYVLVVTSQGQKQCTMMISAMDISNGISIAGDGFYRSLKGVVHDVKNSKIGFVLP